MQYMKVNLTLSDANVQRLRLAAEMEARSIANFVTHAVLAYLNNKDKQQ